MREPGELSPNHNLLVDFEDQVETTPDAPALTMGTRTYTYCQINQYANQIGHALQVCGVEPEQLVGLCLPRSPEAIFAMLGIIKAGGTYVPIDPTYPVERQRFLLEDSDVKILITDDAKRCRELADSVQQILPLNDQSWQQHHPTTNLAVPIAKESLLYVLYTSGSTGNPKGVCGSHAQMRNRLQWLWDAFPAARSKSNQSEGDQGEIWCNKTTLHFVDASLEIFGALLHGSPLVILAEEETTNADRMVQVLRQHGVTRLFIVTSHLRILLLAHPNLSEQLPALTLWITSGEQLTSSLIERFYTALPYAQLVNLYGCTEVPEISWFSVPPNWREDAPIGYPIPGSTFYIVDEGDEAFQLVSVGEVGELVVRSPLMALRYFQRPDETAARFIADPLVADPRIADTENQEQPLVFRTGDHIRQSADGLLHYVGRADHMVKIRGYRVELPEVEAALMKADTTIKTSVAVVRADSLLAENRQIVAFITPATIDVDSVQATLTQQLPSYMVPEQLIALDKFPLTASGKIDRQALLEKVQPIRLSISDNASPQEILTQLWKTILQIEHIQPQASFFEAGGNSLQLAQLHQQLRTFFGDRAPSLTMLLQYSTLDSLARYLGLAEANETIKGVSNSRLVNRTGTIRRQRTQRLKKATQDSRVHQTTASPAVPQQLSQKEAVIDLFPSVGEYPVYDSHLYYIMTNDEYRNQRYRAAIGKLVPGKTVVDIGTGQDAILAVLAAQAGAKKVYALERSDTAYRQAVLHVRRLGLADRIQVLHGETTELSLPEPVDVCLSEVIGNIGGAEGATKLLNDAHRFLKPTGLMIPTRCATQIAAVTLPDSLLYRPRLSESAITYTKKVFDVVGHAFDIRMCLKNLPSTALLSTLATAEDLDFAHIASSESRVPISLTITTAGRLDGFLLWINLYVTEDEIVDSFMHKCNWAPVFFPAFEPGVTVLPGDRVEATCISQLSENQINPDYIITGKVIRQTNTDAEFTYASYYQRPHFKKSPFYQRLFTQRELR